MRTAATSDISFGLSSWPGPPTRRRAPEPATEPLRVLSIVRAGVDGTTLILSPRGLADLVVHDHDLIRGLPLTLVCVRPATGGDPAAAERLLVAGDDVVLARTLAQLQRCGLDATVEAPAG